MSHVNGYVVITNAVSGMSFDLPDASTKNGADVQLSTYAKTATQRWIAVKADDGSYELLSAADTGKALDLSGGLQADGTQLQLSARNGAVSQKWTVTVGKPSSELFNWQVAGSDFDRPDGTTAIKTTRQELDYLAGQNRSALSDGAYAIVSNNVAYRKVLDLNGSSRADRANVQIFGSNASAAQRWRVTHDAKGYVTFTSLVSGKALDVANGRANPGQNVQQYTSNGSYAQKWIVVSLSGGGYKIASALWPDRVLDVAGGSLADRANVQIMTPNGSGAQRWTFYSSQGIQKPAAGSNVLPGDQYGTLRTGTSRGQVIDMPGGSRANGVTAQFHGANGSAAQLYSFRYVNGYYQIVCAGSDKALSVSQADVVPGVSIVQRSRNASDARQLFAARVNGDGSVTFVNKATGFALASLDQGGSAAMRLVASTPDGSASQRFTFAQQKDLLSPGVYRIGFAASGKVLDVAGASTSDAAHLQVYASNGTFAQKWYVQKVAGTDNTYTLESLNSAKRLTASGSRVVQRAANGSASQQWTVAFDGGYMVLRSVANRSLALVASGGSAALASGSGAGFRLDMQRVDASVPSGTYFLRLQRSPGQVVEVNGGSTANGGNVRLWSNNDSGAQKWVISRNGDGTYTIMNARSHKVLDVSGAAAVPGANVQQYQKNGSKAQRWYITYFPGGWRITSALTGALVLEVAGGSTASGANMQINRDGASASQRFLLKSTSYVQEYIGFQNPWPYYQVSSKSVWIKHLGAGQFGYRTPSRIPYNATKQNCVNALVTRAMDYLGTRYVWDYSCAPGVGVDCAGLVMQGLYATGMDLTPFNPWDHFYTPGHDQYANGMWNSSRFQHRPFSQRQVGDLVCYPGHIAIYIGGDRIIEAWPSTGVRIASVYHPGMPIKGVLRPYI